MPVPVRKRRRERPEMPSAAEARELADPDASRGFLTLGKAETSPGPAATFPPAWRRAKGKGKENK